MRKLKEKVENLLAEKTEFEEQLKAAQQLHLTLERKNRELKKQADKVSPLISENVKLTNKLEDLQNEVEQLTDSL